MHSKEILNKFSQSRLSFASTLVFFLFFLSSLNAKAGTVSICGKINQLASGFVVMEQYISVSPIEVARVPIERDGTFQILQEVPEIGFYRLSFETYEYTDIGDQYLNLILDVSGEIEIEATAPFFENTFTIVGSEDSNVLKNINQMLKRSFTVLDSLQAKYSKERASSHVRMDSLSRSFQGPYNRALSDQEDFIRDLVIENASSIAILTVIHFLERQTDVDAYQLVARTLGQKYPNHPYVSSFRRKVEGMTRLFPGSQAPEIILNDVKGNQVKLSNLFGKVVIINFWSSSSWPARQEMADLRRLYEKYKKTNLVILSIGVESERPKWLQVIKEEKMKWTNVTDFLYMESTCVKDYEIKNLPFFFIVAPNGNIVDRGKRVIDLKFNFDAMISEHK